MTPRYRAPRVTLTPLHRIEFDAGGEHARIPLFNISISGVGLLHEPPIPFAVGSELPGELRVGGARYPVRLKIAHVTPKIVGASFIDRSDALKSAIESYFEYELAALTMAKVDPKYHKAEPDGDAHWIHGDRCDLFYVTRGDQLVRFRLTFLGNHFESTAEGGLLAGQLHDPGGSDPLRHKGSEIVRVASHLSPESLALATRFLNQITGLAPSDRAKIAKLLSS